MCFLDARVKPEHDKKKNKSEYDNYLSVIPVLDTGICKGDIRVKPEYDREEFEDDRRKIIPSFPCLTQESKKRCPG